MGFPEKSAVTIFADDVIAPGKPTAREMLPTRSPIMSREFRGREGKKYGSGCCGSVQILGGHFVFRYYWWVLSHSVVGCDVLVVERYNGRNGEMLVEDFLSKDKG